jgi:hypothetical protein
MGYLADLKEHERDHPGEGKAFAKKFGLDSKLEKPDKLAPYRDQRLNRPDGPGSLEPEIT